MDHEVMTPGRPPLPEAGAAILPLSRAEALEFGPALLAMSSDQEWENWTMDHLLLELPEKWRLSLIAMRGLQPVGYAVVSQKAQSVHLHHLIVDASERGSGLGGRMLERIEWEARQSPTPRVTLKVFSSNVRALEFYRRQGFQPGILQENQYLQMSKDLRIP